jgi:hypothetical protein
MADQKNVKVEITQENAVLLLDTAEKDGQDPSVVATSSGHFVVDEALAKKAGVDYTTDADEEKAAAKQLAADDKASGYERNTATKKAAATKTTAAKE